VDDGTEFTSTLVRFARELRGAGLAVGSGEVLTYSAAAAVLDPSDLVDLYWAGRTTLVTRYEEIATYNRVFRRYFLYGEDEPSPARPFRSRTRAAAESVVTVADPETGEPGGDEQEAKLGLVASDVTTLRSKSFGACTPEELATVHRMIRDLRLSPPRRRTRRTAPARAGRTPDLRRTLRRTMRTHGEAAELFWRGRRWRPRRLVLILDVSGSMADYSRSLLQFAYSTARATSRVEVFCFGTRLTRITRELDHRRPDQALDRASRAVVDWEGGTRIGDCLDRFVRDYGRRGVCRGGIVVICSDGLDRGDPAVLAAAMARLARLSHRIVWMNPHKENRSDFRPSTLGMMVAAPHVDLLHSGHDLRSLAEFAALLPRLG
jgi:uncharacterized protein